MTRRSIASVVVGLVVVSATAVGAVAYTTAARQRVEAESQALQAILRVRTAALADYLSSIRSEVTYWAQEPRMREVLADFATGWGALGPDATETLQRLYIDENPYPQGSKDKLQFADDASAYSDAHHSYHPWLQRFRVHNGYYDVFLVDRDGNLIYTAFKEADFATNLDDGRWKDTDLARVFRAARDAAEPGFVAFTDFAPYDPSFGGEPASFISSPILDDAGTLLGVLAFQIPSDRLNQIMQARAGMGESGETYIVGRDFTMRSNSRFALESTILNIRVDSDTVKRALRGETGVDVTPDYRGISVLSVYSPLEFEGVTWAVMAEIDEDEVLEPVRRLRNVLLAGGAGVTLVLAVLSLLLARRL